MALVSVCDIAPENVCDRLAVLIGAHENVYLVPFLAVVGDCAVFKVSDKPVCVLSRTQRIKAGKLLKLRNAFGREIRQLFLVGGFIVVRGLENLHEVLHSRTHNQTVFSAF